MPESYQKSRYSQEAIHHFVEAQHTIETTPLVAQHIKVDELFQSSEKPKDPIDIVYRFQKETPARAALAFQQVDGESDVAEMFSLVYVDPGLAQAWKEQTAHISE
ncbi:hypothetical protein [Tengunoibacter tsumagoiensis]|uniref:Uncharacterized protein n=1 Tax=Tengunoibacter tsumagoiensis TaxID=2014871 RepID=A0A402AA65_9CHLR|nr:hypothetical protein [Tengunoibacter tsumagoiensis]GCE15926.1 hypothetical protein KTT_57850 [Tengunoibacter tsumagoiensis]